MKKVLRKRGAVRLLFSVVLAAMMMSLLACAAYADGDTRTITVTETWEQNENSEGSELWLRGIVVDGEEIPAYLAFSEGWIEEEGYLKWRAFDQPEGMTGSVTAEVPADAEVSLVFQANKWRGIAQVTDGDNTYEVDCYEDTEAPDVAIMANADERVPAGEMRVITVSADGSKNEDAEGTEIWITGVVVNGEKVAPEKVFTNGWTEDEGCLKWFEYDRPEDQQDSVTMNVPEGGEVQILFQANMWRGIAHVTEGDQTTDVDCYADSEAGDLEISADV